MEMETLRVLYAKDGRNGTLAFYKMADVDHPPLGGPSFPRVLPNTEKNPFSVVRILDSLYDPTDSQWSPAILVLLPKMSNDVNTRQYLIMVNSTRLP